MEKPRESLKNLSGAEKYFYILSGAGEVFIHLSAYLAERPDKHLGRYIHPFLERIESTVNVAL